MLNMPIRPNMPNRPINHTIVMKKLLPTIILSMLCALSVQAQEVKLDSATRDTAYVATIQKRAAKIVAALNLTDGQKRQNVENIIANRYFKIADMEQQAGKDKQALQSELYLHHFEFAADLANYISDEQIEQVKNGMTYGVVPKTYGAYLDMIPSLKPEEKLQILNWLKEAREFAIDAGDSKAKHGWFKKYKGRINNWLSKRGYDIQAEREAWTKRIEEAKKNK